MKKYFTIKYIPPFIVILFTLLLLNLPMTDVLSYEFAAVQGIILFLTGGIVTVILSRKNSEVPIIGILTENKYYYLTLLVIPFIISFIYNIIIVKCPVCEGIQFYFLISAVSFIMGISIGYLSFAVFNKFAITAFIIISFLLLLVPPVFEIYYYPQIYFYHSVIGFFPGTIYDEFIQIDSKLVIYRLYLLTASVLLLFVSDRIKNSGHGLKYGFFFLLLIAAGVIFTFKSEFGLATNYERLNSSLGGYAESDHFQLYFPAEIDSASLNDLILHHEYYYKTIKDELEVEPKEKIKSFIFKNREQKRILFGAGNADVAKPWMNSIFIDFDDFDNTLKHELIHVFSAQFGVTPFLVADNFNPAMIEGLAMAIENDFDKNTVHYMAALAYQNNFRFELNSLFSGFNFLGGTSSISYIYSGSFIRYLKDNYGIAKVKLLYGDIDFEKYYGKNINVLSGDYYKFLETIKPDTNKHKANLYFGYSPIFKKYCVRYAAKELRKSWQDYNNGDFTKAKTGFESLYSLTGSYSSLLGYINSLKKLSKYKMAEGFLEKEMKKFDGTSYFYNLETTLGDLYIINHDYSSADSTFRELLSQNPKTDYSEIAEMRIGLINADHKIAHDYITGSNYDRYEILKSLFASDEKIVFISELIRYSSILEENYPEFKSGILSKIETTDSLTSSIYDNLTGFAMSNFDYEEAEYFARKSLNLATDRNKLEILSSSLKKIEWLNHKSAFSK